MENLRELLNIYFSEDEGGVRDAKKENENIFESVFNSYFNEEKYINNIFNEIIGGSEKTFTHSPSEKIIKGAFESGKSISGVNINEYINRNVESAAKEFFRERSFENINKSFINNEESRYSVSERETAERESGLLESEKFLIYDKDLEVAAETNETENDAIFNAAYYSTSGNKKSGNFGQTENISRNLMKYSYGDLYDGEDNGIMNYLSENENKSINYYNDSEDFGVINSGGDVKGEYKLSQMLKGTFYPQGFQFEGNNEQEDIKAVLNGYFEGESGGTTTVNNNISPTVNLYSNGNGYEQDIDEIAEKIGELLAEAAAGAANGYYG